MGYMKKKVTLSVDEKIYDNFQELCEEKGLMLSRQIEIWMEERIKEEKDGKGN